VTGVAILFAPRFLRIGVAAIFLDLYGVLVDSVVVETLYNERMAAILERRFGGGLDRWLRTWMESYERYQAGGAELDRRPGEEREGDAWVEAVYELNADQMRYALQHMGCEIPADLHDFAEAAEAETVRGIDGTYPDVRPALTALQDDGHRLFLSTNANRANAESALVGGGIRGFFDGLLMLETGRAKKDRPYYWRRAFEHARSRPEEAIVVDDQARFLRPAHELGARGVQLIRAGLRRATGEFPVLDSLAAVADVLR